MKCLLLALLTAIPLLANAKPATELAGRYVLQGARETGSTLLLKANGHFQTSYAWLQNTPVMQRRMTTGSDDCPRRTRKES